MGDLGSAAHVAVIAAMVQEIRPIVRRLRLEPVTTGGLEAREGTVGGRRVVSAVTSMGTAAATDVTERILAGRDVDHVIVVGICGGIDPGLPIGSLIVPAETMVEASGRIGHPVPLGPHEPAGRLLTTDQLHNDPATVARLHADGFVAVDMETAAIGAVCDDRGVPWSVFRAISDRAGDPEIDPELMGMSKPDGTPDLRAVARYVVRHPSRLAKLASLGGGLRKAVAASTDAALDVLTA